MLELGKAVPYLPCCGFLQISRGLDPVAEKVILIEFSERKFVEYIIKNTFFFFSFVSLEKYLRFAVKWGNIVIFFTFNEFLQKT
jgi:hypothetical protein